MPSKIKTFKPITPGRRQMTVVIGNVTKNKPEKSLIRPHKGTVGRSYGTITIRHRGGGSKRFYRLVDFSLRGKMEMSAKVLSIEYDPNRTALIALIEYADAEKSYILAPLNLSVGDTIICSKQRNDIKAGNRLLLKNIPVGSVIHNIELVPNGGGQIVRSAGVSASIMGIEKDYVFVKLPSGEVRKFKEDCLASIGQLSLPEHFLESIGKAGRSRWMGIRPTVRGKVMNPVDHPHGGGEGRNSIGLIHPKTPWGLPALGYKTRRPKKPSNRLILKRRK